ncbi:extracellular ribonuclease LE-like isoform X1 [Apium graveolens]|uniref:extracellular ribonuclease LE-like isoform X1 n=1 Tax=Apium graveolens TaxID=4045 RepID=UPI003D7B0EFF
MKSMHSKKLIIRVLIIQCLAVVCFAQDFDFFYFSQQWPGSYCDLKRSCCYPSTGKPASDFGIHGLWPNYIDGSYPSNCDPDSSFNESMISDLRSKMQKEWPTLSCPSANGTEFWGHEWKKHGTCSESVLDQHDYFATTLNLKSQVNLLQTLANAGIYPDGEFYSLESIKGAIKQGTGYTPHIECNVNAWGNSQLYEVYMCVDTSGSNLIKCPIFPRERCKSQIQFPSFSNVETPSFLSAI